MVQQITNHSWIITVQLHTPTFCSIDNVDLQDCTTNIMLTLRWVRTEQNGTVRYDMIQCTLHWNNSNSKNTKNERNEHTWAVWVCHGRGTMQFSYWCSYIVVRVIVHWHYRSFVKTTRREIRESHGRRLAAYCRWQARWRLLLLVMLATYVMVWCCCRPRILWTLPRIITILNQTNKN